MAKVTTHTTTVKRISVELSIAEAKALVGLIYEIAQPDPVAIDLCCAIAEGFGYNLPQFHEMKAHKIANAEEVNP